jgi:hypothetical protein
MDLYTAQRTNFKPSAPRLAGKPGQQRQTTKRSANRGRAAVLGRPAPTPPAARPMPGKPNPRPGKRNPMPPAGMPTRGPGKQKPMPPTRGPMPPSKKPMSNRPGGVKRPMPKRPGGVVGKKKGYMSMMKKMAAFKPGM